MKKFISWESIWGLSLIIMMTLPSTSHSGNLRLRCQFIPYTHCSYQVSVELDVEEESDLLDNLFIKYSGENISLHPRLFSHTVHINGTPFQDDVFLRVRNGKVTFNHRYNETFITAINDILPGKVHLEIQSQRIPLLVEDKENGIGWMHLELMGYIGKGNIEYQLLSHARVRMKPTNGCWLDEHACVNYPD